MWYPRPRMPKPVFEEATFQKLVDEISNFPIQAGPNGNLIDPGIRDLLADESTKTCPWEPADRRTSLLVMGTEACREVTYAAEALAKLGVTKRAVKNLAIPVCNLMDVAVELQRELNDEEAKRARVGW